MDVEDSISQFEEVFEGAPWYGPSLITSLTEIPVEFWDQKLPHTAHTIAELVTHMVDWRIFVIEKLKDNQSYSIEMNSEMDWRNNVSIEDETGKTELITRLTKTQHEILELLDQKPDSWMYEFVLGKDYKNEYMVLGTLQHDIYHLGQINWIYATLKRKKCYNDESKIQ